jgi:hypothetical protein
MQAGLNRALALLIASNLPKIQPFYITISIYEKE